MLSKKQPRAIQGILDDPQIKFAIEDGTILELLSTLDQERAQRLMRWLASTARQHLEESQNPELAILRTRRAYEQHGYSRQWIDQRMRSVSARHELTGEWYKRGARQG